MHLMILEHQLYIRLVPHAACLKCILGLEYPAKMRDVECVPTTEVGVFIRSMQCVTTLI